MKYFDKILHKSLKFKPSLISNHKIYPLYIKKASYYD